MSCIARSIIYFPVGARGAGEVLGFMPEIRLPDGSRASLGRLTLRELLNIRVKDALGLWDAIWHDRLKIAHVPVTSASAAPATATSMKQTPSGSGRTLPSMVALTRFN